ncbi:hypothetical protein FQZ97_1132550 [compost metagenome]
MLACTTLKPVSLPEPDSELLRMFSTFRLNEKSSPRLKVRSPPAMPRLSKSLTSFSVAKSSSVLLMMSLSDDE